MITALIFSKDRALQLDAALQSLLLHCQDASMAEIAVLFAASDERHARQYRLLQEAYRGHAPVRFLRQTAFRRDLFEILNPFAAGSRADRLYRMLILAPVRTAPVVRHLLPAIDPARLVLFLVDDNLFVRNFSLLEIASLMQRHRDSIGFSLRLGRNTTYCYSHAVPQPLPAFTPVTGAVFKFDWTASREDFGYPLEVSSSVYRLREIIPLLFRFGFANPNFLEGGMASRARRYANRLPNLLCFGTSVAFCNPVNMVQTVVPNRAGIGLHYSSGELADRFDQEFRIDVASYDQFTPNGCHQEIELKFKKV